MGTNKRGYFSSESTIRFNLITCEGRFAITLIIQGLKLHWYHMYLLNPVIDITEGSVHQCLYRH